MGLFKRKKTEDASVSSVVKTDSDDSYINAKSIYNIDKAQGGTILILISFTEDYYHDAIEFLANARSLWTQYVHSSYDEDTGEKDTHNDPIYIVHNKHYLLVNGTDYEYYDCFYNMPNIANEFVKVIYECLSDNRPLGIYAEIEKYMPYQINFWIAEDKIQYDNLVDSENGYQYTDVNYIMKQLPKAFNVIHIFPMAMIYSPNGSMSLKYGITQAVHYAQKNSKYIALDLYVNGDLADACKPFVHELTAGTLETLVGPTFLLQDEDAMAGSVTDESLDEIFRQKYDRYSAVNSENVVYANMDDVIADDAEEENMSESDKTNLFNAKEVFDSMQEEVDT